jgi:hypothetical protein
MRLEINATPQELQELTDGEVLDLIYKIVEDDTLGTTEIVNAVKRVLEDCKGS